MREEESKFFNINTMLKNVFESLDRECKDRKVDLVFIFGKNVPCQMKGDVTTLYIVLVKILCRVLANYNNDELLLSVDAPEDFLHREAVTFKISNLALSKEDLLLQLQGMLSDNLEKLDAQLAYSEENGGSLLLTLLLTNAELGCRRHYRMPLKTMLNKDILLIIESNNLALSLTKMFKYFPMNIDLCLKKCKKDRYDFAQYDLVLMEDKLFDYLFYELLQEAQEKSEMKFVLLGDRDIYREDDESKLHTFFLKKPVTQESVYNLLVSIFEDLPTLA